MLKDLKNNILKPVCSSLGLPHAHSLSVACLHVLVSCVYAFCSYIDRRPVLVNTLVLQTKKLYNDIYV